MSNEQIEQQSNPLKKYYRQPKQFVKLPSNYRFYTEGSISVPESREVAVYPMTAKDEMMFKTPDALLNGQATVDVIQSCWSQTFCCTCGIETLLSNSKPAQNETNISPTRLA